VICGFEPRRHHQLHSSIVSMAARVTVNHKVLVRPQVLEPKIIWVVGHGDQLGSKPRGEGSIPSRPANLKGKEKICASSVVRINNF
jgi:hypothetical protein